MCPLGCQGISLHPITLKHLSSRHLFSSFGSCQHCDTACLEPIAFSFHISGFLSDNGLPCLLVSLSSLFSFWVFLSPYLKFKLPKREALIGSDSHNLVPLQATSQGLSLDQVLVPGSTSCGQGCRGDGHEHGEFPIVSFQKETVDPEASLSLNDLWHTNP